MLERRQHRGPHLGRLARTPVQELHPERPHLTVHTATGPTRRGGVLPRATSSVDATPRASRRSTRTSSDAGFALSCRVPERSSGSYHSIVASNESRRP